MKNKLQLTNFRHLIGLLAALLSLLFVSQSAWAYYQIRGTMNSWNCWEMNSNNQYLVYSTGTSFDFKICDGCSWTTAYSTGGSVGATPSGTLLETNKGNSTWGTITNGAIYGWTFDNNHKLYISKISLQMYDPGKKADVYLGDYVSTSDYWVYYLICFSNFGGAKVAFFNSTSSVTDVDAEWYEDDGNNRKYKANLKNKQFTSTGNWYAKGAVSATNDNTKYAYSNNSTNAAAEGTTTLSANTNGAVYWNVQALPNATAQTATAASSSQIDLAWTKNATKTTVMIVRYQGASPSVTAPTNGTSYSVGGTIGAGTVIYKGTGATKSDTGLSENTKCKYYFYTVNNNYYSSGVNASATTQSACTPPDAPSITGTTEVCSGSTTTLTSSNAYTVWYVGSTKKGTGATYTTDEITDNITVDAYAYSGDESCKSSKVSTNITKKDKPAQPGSISGGAALCANTTYTNRFSITAVSGATSYTWSKSGDGNFTVNGNGMQCTVTTASNYNGGTLQVIATNDCGSSTARTLSLTKVADPTASLSASASVVCTGSDVTITATVTNVDTYTWSTPTGWTLKSSSEKSATYKTAGTGSQTITYTGTNSCSVQQQAQVSVTAAPYPSGTTISSGAASQCIGTTGAQYTASSTAVTGSIYSYSWSVSGTGWSRTSSASANPATFTVGTATGTISVTPTLTTSGKACAGSAVNKSVTVNGVTIGNPSPAAPHAYEPTTFTASAAATWDVFPSSVEAYLSTDTGTSTVLKAKAGTYKVTATKDGCDTEKDVTVVIWSDKCN